MPKAVYDFVVVGAGTAGSLLSSRLAAANYSVLLLEAGPSNHVSKITPWLRVPLGYLYTMTMPSTSWKGFQTNVGSRTIHYPRGRVLGGCSSINGMIYQQGQPSDYDDWNSPGWSGSEMTKMFDRFHNDLSPRPPSCARSPPNPSNPTWPCSPQRLSWDVLSSFQLAVEEVVPLANAAPNVGGGGRFVDSSVECCGPFLVNQRNGVRVSAYDAFVAGPLGGEVGGPVPLLAHNNEEEKDVDGGGDGPRPAKKGSLSVRAGSFVRSLLFDGENTKEDGKGRPARAVGVEFWNEPSPGVVDDSKTHRVYAGKEVLLCTGSIGSPHLLQVSGIGDAAELKEKGVEKIVADLPGVGKNLQDHLQIRSIYRLKDGTVSLNSMANSLIGRALMGLEYGLLRRGPLSMAPSQVGAFLKSSPDVPHPDLQWHVQPLSLDAFGQPLHPFPGMTAAVCVLRPTSRGSVTLKSKDIRDPPDIECNYLKTPRDKDIARKGLRLTRKIVLESGAMSKYNPSELLPGPGAVSDSDLDAAALKIGTSIFHPVGTCKMGAGPDAVVDERLRVHGVRGLRVVDASIMPNITSGNTNTPTLAIAEKGADMIIEDWAGR